MMKSVEELEGRRIEVEEKVRGKKAEMLGEREVIYR